MCRFCQWPRSNHCLVCFSCMEIDLGIVQEVDAMAQGFEIHNCVIILLCVRPVQTRRSVNIYGVTELITHWRLRDLCYE
jgi:hypothetical protein